MEIIYRASIEPKIVFRVAKPWRYVYSNAFNDRHYTNTRDALGDMTKAFKIANDVEEICQEAINSGEAGVVSSVSVQQDSSEIVCDEVYLIEDTNRKPERFESQWHFDTLAKAIEHVLGDYIPIRDPLYDNFTYVNSNGDNKTLEFYTFEELVEYVYTNKIAVYSCPSINHEEEEYIKKLQHYMVMVALTKK